MIERRLLARFAAALALSMAVGCANKRDSSHVPAAAVTAIGEPRNALDQYNFERELGVHGYDPVSFFAEGGGAPVRGAVDNAVRYRGVTYAFASADNRAAFEASPAKYEPAYGGWCAWAMAKGGNKVDPDPELYLIQGDRLMLFYGNALVDTRKKWEKGDVQRLEVDADDNWQGLTGETPAGQKLGLR